MSTLSKALQYSETFDDELAREFAEILKPGDAEADEMEQTDGSDEEQPGPVASVLARQSLPTGGA